MDFERIWLQNTDLWSESTWCQHRVDDHDIEYVRIDVAEKWRGESAKEGMEDATKLECRWCYREWPLVVLDEEHEGNFFWHSAGGVELSEPCFAPNIQRVLYLEKETEND